MTPRASEPDLLTPTCSWLRRAWRDERGGFAVWFAAMVPAISALVVGAVELQTLAADRTVMQGAADAAALAGAKELALGEAGVTDRAKAFAEAQLALLSRRYRSMDVTAALGGDGRSLMVMISANRLSFFGNMLPPGGFKTLVKSAAGSMNQQQVCVLTLHASSGDILVADSAKVTADGCMVHSAHDLSVNKLAGLSAGAAQAVGVASGPITPSGASGAAHMADPFAGRDLSIPTCEQGNFRSYTLNGLYVLPPGAYCGNFDLVTGAQVYLKPGTYYFVGADDTKYSGRLSLKGNAKLYGDGVTLIFDRSSKLMVFDTAKLNLRAPTAGPNAGMLLVAPPANAKQFTLSSSSVDVLEGVIYTPGAELIVEGDNVADQSKWTISVTKALTVKNGASLWIKSDYAGSAVPVPSGMKAAESGVVTLLSEGGAP